MKYTVSLGMEKFTFDDGTTAMNFAELALEHFTPTEYNKTVRPLIEVEEGEGDA